MQVRFDLFSFEFEGRLINFKKGADSFSIVFFLSKLLYLDILYIETILQQGKR